MLGYIFFLISAITITKVSADFAYHFKYCSFKCGCSIETTEPIEPTSNSDDPKGFYWRDFYGDIPEDAYPVGEKDQNPQTYIGKVFDPSHNGTFLTTIFEGFDYVYNAFNNTVTKKNTHMQIMCTRSPKKLLWQTITTENVKNFPDYIYVTASAHLGYVERYKSTIIHSFYIVKTTKSKVTYIGSASNLTDLLEYATSDGIFQTSDTKMFLLYKKNEDNATTSEKPKRQPFFKHLYKFSLNAGSIIPKFYVEQHVGSCSLVCTNEGTDEKSGHGKKSSKNSVRSSAAMAYYWQTEQIFDANDALKSFVSYENKTVYAGQGYSQSLNWLDVGQSGGSSVPFKTTHRNQSYIIIESNDVQILSTKHPEKFEWVNATYENFASIDKSKLIPGGELNNGTQVFIGRIMDQEFMAPASIRVFENGLYYGYSYNGDSDKVQLLMFKTDNKHNLK